VWIHHRLFNNAASNGYVFHVSNSIKAFYLKMYIESKIKAIPVTGFEGP
jgi:hypothetical protein